MRSLMLAAVGSLALGASLRAQETVQNYASVASYVFSIPSGDTRGFLTTPSWFGISWEGVWGVGRRTAAGIAVGVHEFDHSSFGTTTYPWGATTGRETRTLVATSAMATGRWYPLVEETRRLHVGLGAGVVYSEETYRLGAFQSVRGAAHLAVAPEAGWQFPMVAGIDALVTARYTFPMSNGDYLGGAHRYPFATLGFGILER